MYLETYICCGRMKFRLALFLAFASLLDTRFCEAVSNHDQTESLTSGTHNTEEPEINGTGIDSVKSMSTMARTGTLGDRLRSELSELPDVLEHLMPEIERTKPLPGDPYRSQQPATRSKRFSPGHHEIPWMPKLRESELKQHVPTWHGWAALKLPDGCPPQFCDPVVEVVSQVAKKAFHDHELRGPLVGSAPEPVLLWLPPIHEMHSVHERPVIFNGPWTTVEVSRFVNNRCTRAAKVGRAFVGDIFAAKFVRAKDKAQQEKLLTGLRKLQWQYREGRSQPVVQQRLRYYEDMMHAAMTEGLIGPDHFSMLSKRLEEQLMDEVYKDAFAEVSLIRHNIAQAFLQSSADPTLVHNWIMMDVEASAAKEKEEREKQAQSEAA